MALVVLAAEPPAAISAQEPQMRVLVAEGRSCCCGLMRMSLCGCVVWGDRSGG